VPRASPGSQGSLAPFFSVHIAPAPGSSTTARCSDLRGGGSGRGEGPGAAPWGLRSAPARTRPCQVSESIGSQGSRRGRVVWSAHCSWRYAVSFSSWVLNHLALFILDICRVEFWKSLLLLELRMRVFEVFLQSWNISCFFSGFFPTNSDW